MTGYLCRAAAGLTAAAIIAVAAGCGSQAGSPSPPQASGGPVLSITAARGCPAVARGHVASTAGTSAAELAPPDPDGGLVCRYGALGPGFRHLQQSAHLTAQSARRIASLLSTLPTPPHGAVACPASNGARDIIAFTYPHRPDADVDVGSSCGGVTNGRVDRVLTQALRGALAAIVGELFPGPAGSSYKICPPLCTTRPAATGQALPDPIGTLLRTADRPASV